MAGTIDPNSLITFPSNAEFDVVEMTNDLTVTKINNEEYTKYVRVKDDQKYNVGGTKTFESGSTSNKVGMSLRNLRGIFELNLDT